MGFQMTNEQRKEARDAWNAFTAQQAESPHLKWELSELRSKLIAFTRKNDTQAAMIRGITQRAESAEKERDSLRSSLATAMEGLERITNDFCYECRSVSVAHDALSKLGGEVVNP